MPRGTRQAEAKFRESALGRGRHDNRSGPFALLKRTFDIDVLECPRCHARMKLLAMITDGNSVERYLTKLSEPTDVPARSASRGPPNWKSRVLRLKPMAGQA